MNENLSKEMSDMRRQFPTSNISELALVMLIDRMDTMNKTLFELKELLRARM